MNQPRKLRWVLEHEPVELFLRTAKAFDEQIRLLTSGAIEIEILTLDEYIDLTKNETAGLFNPLVDMDNGKIDMSQTHIQNLGTWYNPQFYALELPYIFKDHDHATRVLEGDIGKSLLDDLQNTSPAVGLAFTYSGGYRVFASKQPINSAEDLVGLRCVTGSNPIQVDTAKAFGIIPTPSPSTSYILTVAERKALHQDNALIETTLPRYEKEAYDIGQNYIADTAHSMYLTSIIISKKLWATFSEKEKQCMHQAALETSRLEREWSINDAQTISTDTAKHDQLGIVYNSLNDVERDKLRQASSIVYDKYQQFFDNELITRIINS